MMRLMSLSHGALRTWVACSKHISPNFSTGMNQTTQKGELAARQVSSDVLDLSVGQPSPCMLPLSKVAAAANHRLASPDSDPLLLQYGARQGYRSFRQALATFLEPLHQGAICLDTLMVVAGASHGLDLVCSHLAKPGDVVLVEGPTYFLARGILTTRGLRPLAVPTDEQGVDVVALEKLLGGCDAPRPRLMYIIPVYNNPRGTVLPAARRRRLVELAHQHDFHIMADEVYQLLYFPEAALPPPAMRTFEDQELRSSPASRVISVGSFSKIMAPGLRLGWLEASPDCIETLKKDGMLSSGGCINPIATGMMHSALELGLLQEHLMECLRPSLASNAAALCAALRRHLPSASFLQPQGGYFVWLELPEQVDAQQLLKGAAARHRVSFTPGAACGGLPNHLRLSFSFYSPAELEEAAARLAAAVHEFLDTKR